MFEAIQRARKGLIDADLGGDVIKQRIARKGQGKSRGFRSIVLFRRDELMAFRALADEMLVLDESALDAALANGTIVEVMRNG